MKTSFGFQKFILSFVVVGSVVSARAEKLDLETHNSLIQKLESVVDIEKTDSMVSQPKLTHRLADLYAERARLLTLDNEGQGEKVHHDQINSDRTKALSIYQGLQGSLTPSESGTVLMQMAHLHNLQGNSGKAQEIYEKIEKNPKNYSPAIWALALIQIGDSQFLRGEFSQAQKSFEKSLQVKENPRAPYARFRLAWTHYHQGATKRAEIETIDILKNPKSFVTKSGAPDVSFQEEVSHDLATFMAKNQITEQSLKNLMTYSPEDLRKKNLIYLATELDRTAKKQEALKVWAIIGTTELSLEDKLDRQVQITRIQYDLGHTAQLLKEIDAMIVLLQDKSCRDNQDCIIAQQNFRKIITDWGKAEERVPTEGLIAAYGKYTTAFNDAEMSYWAAQAAKSRSLFAQAFGFYKKAAELTQNPRVAKTFEGALLGAMEVAELSKSRALRFEGYQLYLSMNSQGSRASEVRYQIAHWSYEGNDYAKAREQFKVLALDASMPADLREKSADLCLDTDVILKNESYIEEDSLTFAQSTLRKKSEYLAMWRKSILNQTAGILNASATKDTNSRLASEYKKISAIPLKAWPQEQRKMMIKNKINISFRLKDLESLSVSSLELLAETRLTLEERNSALQNLAWIQEMKLNFAAALNWQSQVKVSSSAMPEHLLKIAALKELTQQNPSVDYRNFIKISRDFAKKTWASHQLVFYSAAPASEFNKQEKLLAKNSALYNEAGVWAIEHEASSSAAARLSGKLLSKSSFRTSALGKLVTHQPELTEYQALQKKAAGLKLASGNDRKIKQSLQARTQSLKKLESKANGAIAKKDTSLQIMYLTTLSLENSRLGSDIMSLPLPKGLKAQEKDQYQAQVKKMVEPYFVQAQAIRMKTLEMWKQSMAQNTFKDLFDWSVEKNKAGARFAAREIEFLRAAASQIGLSQDPFKNFSEERRKVASRAEEASQRVKENPFEFSDLEKMKSLQSDLGGGPMIAYLNVRKEQLSKYGETK